MLYHFKSFGDSYGSFIFEYVFVLVHKKSDTRRINRDNIFFYLSERTNSNKKHQDSRSDQFLVHIHQFPHNNFNQMTISLVQCQNKETRQNTMKEREKHFHSSARVTTGWRKSLEPFGEIGARGGLDNGVRGARRGDRTHCARDGCVWVCGELEARRLVEQARCALGSGRAGARVAERLDETVKDEGVENRDDVIDSEFDLEDACFLHEGVDGLGGGVAALGDEDEALLLERVDEVLVELGAAVPCAARELARRLDLVEHVHLLGLGVDGVHALDDLARLEDLQRLGDLHALEPRLGAEFARLPLLREREKERRMCCNKTKQKNTYSEGIKKESE